jgi:uncharacterized repeat protein (TIGR03987 family)
MKPILIAGTTIVNLALISYTLFIFSERRTKRTGKRVLTFLTLGVILDITATICMIAGSSNSPFTLHGILGYSALTGMLIDALLLWRSRLKNGQGSSISISLHNYSFLVYCWWIAAYITGALVVMLK